MSEGREGEGGRVGVCVWGGGGGVVEVAVVGGRWWWGGAKIERDLCKHNHVLKWKCGALNKSYISPVPFA